MDNCLKNMNFQNLTTREKEVLDYLVQGFHNLEIAQKLGISSHTAKAHVSSILHKFGVKTRTSAVRIAVMEKMNKCN